MILAPGRLTGPGGMRPHTDHRFAATDTTVALAATSATVTASGCSPPAMSGMSRLTCSRPTNPGARPAKATVAGLPPSVACTAARGRESGLAGDSAPSVTGRSTRPCPVTYTTTYSPGWTGFSGAFRTQLAPVTVSVKAAEPAVAEVGEIVAIAGEAKMANDCANERPVPDRKSTRLN